MCASPRVVPSTWPRPVIITFMGAVEFVARAIDSLAWPLIVLTLALIFRSSLSRVIEGVAARMPQLRSLDAAGFKAEFAAETGQALEKAKRAPEAAHDHTGRRQDQQEARAGASTDQALERALALAATYPRVAIIEAFVHLENRVMDRATEAGWDAGRGRVRSFTAAMQYLASSRHLSTNLVAAAQDLRRLRNDAVHRPDFSISESAAEEFVITASIIIDALAED